MEFLRILKNNKMKSISKFSFLVALFTVNVLIAQQDPNFTLYNFNMNIINPAYAGANNEKELNLSHRSQWLGVDNSPNTQTLSYSMPLKNNLGFGISIVNDKVFILSETDIAVDVSYKLKVSETHNLFFGVKAGGGFVNIDLNNAGAPGGDPLFTANQSFFNPHLGAGLYLKHKKYYVTISTPNFLNGKRYEKKGNTPKAAVDNMHLYLGTGYSFTINDNFELNAVCFKYDNNFSKYRLISSNMRYMCLGTYDSLYEFRINSTKKAIITEGEIECISIRNVTDLDLYALHNVNSLKVGEHQDISKYEEIFVFLDNDKYNEVKDKVYNDLKAIYKGKITMRPKFTSDDKNLDFNSFLINKGVDKLRRYVLKLIKEEI